MKIEKFNNKNANKLKTVNYFGVQIQIPDYTRYVATDEDSSVFAYIFEPTIDDELNYWNSKNCDHEELGVSITFDNHDVNWKKSLVAFPSQLAVEEECSPYPTKTVSYFGTDLQVPCFAKYIATNADGTIVVYDDCPQLDLENWTVSPNGVFCTPIGACTFKNHNTSWSQSLVEVA